ncbi:MAG: hypothetical protein OEZ13_07580 [Spirochaetia bacterium]|nr:hypothetical protein [Spirochaetia bacterium]
MIQKYGQTLFCGNCFQQIKFHQKQKEWYSMVKQIMKYYSLRVPGSFVEEKKHSICWHYRKSPRYYAEFQARKLHEELETGLSSLPVTNIKGKKVVEARAVESKGICIKVGEGRSRASYRLKSHEDVLPFIMQLIKLQSKENQFYAKEHLQSKKEYTLR